MSSALLGPYPSLVAVSLTSYWIFHKYEPQRPIPALSLLIVVPAAFSWCNQQISTPFTFFVYYLLLVLFTVAYRLSPFHPLADFPGPFINKLTRFRLAQVVARGDLHHYHQRLFLKYGDIVRIGPNDLSYNKVDGVESILKALPKGPLYTYGESIVILKDPSEYTLRRDLWNKAFSSSSLKLFEPKLLKRADELMEGLDKHKSNPVDISKWMEYFAFDFMGDFVFNFPFEMLKQGNDQHGYRKIIIESMQPLICLLHVPWVIIFITSFIDPAAPLSNLANRMVTHRVTNGSNTNDLYSYLSREDGKETKESLQLLIDDAFAAIVAGSDTTSTVMANLWSYLMQNRQCYNRLREEVDATFAPGEAPTDHQRLASMPYLNACLNETMRMMPPVPSGSQRRIIEGGKMIGRHFVPEGQYIILHPYSLQRDPRNFSPAPETFWPDRWLSPESRRSLLNVSKPLDPSVEVVHDMTAFIPFSAAPRSCPGKNLAMMEMRLVAALVMQRFDMTVAKGYDVNQWEGSLRDCFIITKGALPVLLSDRL